MPDDSDQRAGSLSWLVRVTVYCGCVRFGVRWCDKSPEAVRNGGDRYSAPQPPGHARSEQS